jgi:putative oxidoreductase
VLGVAVYALQVVKGFGWTWNTGGYEFPVFWALMCIAIAIEEWKSALATGRARALPAGTPLAA